MKNNTSIEALESRIAPAAVFTFTDVDGDAVTIKTSKGTNAELAAVMTTADVGVGKQLRKIDFSMNATAFAGTDLIVSVVKKPGGDGFVNIGAIDATDLDGSGAKLDLGKVVIPGDLGKIAGGDTDSNTLAMKSLTVRSMGNLGLATQGGSGNLVSDLRGGVGSIVVKGDIRDASIGFSTNGMGTEALSKLGSLTIGGSLIGGAGATSGAVFANSGIGVIAIGRDIVGGSGDFSGYIQVNNAASSSVTIRGSIVGASGFKSGYVALPDVGVLKLGYSVIGDGGEYSGGLDADLVGALSVGGDIVGAGGSKSGRVDIRGGGSVKVAGSIIGGSGPTSGGLGANGSLDERVNSVVIGGSIVGGTAISAGSVDLKNVTTLTIKGSVIGGTESYTGRVLTNDLKSIRVGGSIVGGTATTGTIVYNGSIYANSATKITSVFIGGSIVGGSASGAASLIDVGSLALNDDVGSIVVKGSLIAGEDNSTGAFTESGAISVRGTIGSLAIGGSVTGSATHRATIAANGPGAAPAGSTQELAIGKITIGGSVTRADILAGYSDIGSPIDGDSSIGSVFVKGDWAASNISAGVKDMSGNGFGNGDDVSIATGNNVSITARIASIVIGGSVAGSSAAGDHFGFVAQQIGIVKIGGSTIFTGTTSLDAPKELSALTGDVTIRETM